MNTRPATFGLIASTMLAILLGVAIPAWTIWGLWGEGFWAILFIIIAQWLLILIPLGLYMLAHDLLRAIGKGLCRMFSHEDARRDT